MNKYNEFFIEILRVVLILKSIILYFIFLYLLFKYSIAKMKPHFKLMQIDDPEELAGYNLEDVTLGRKGSMYARFKLILLYIPLYFKSKETKSEEYLQIEEKVIEHNKRLQKLYFIIIATILVFGFIDRFIL